MCILSNLLSHIWLFATLWTIACQVPLSMGFSRHEYWSGLLCSPPGDLPNPGIKSRSPALQADSLPAKPQGKPRLMSDKMIFHFIWVENRYMCVFLGGKNHSFSLCTMLNNPMCAMCLVVQSCLTLCDPMNCSPSGSLVHGLFQAWILEWVAISFSRGSSQPRDRTQVSHTVGRCFTIWAIFLAGGNWPNYLPSLPSLALQLKEVKLSSQEW